MPDNEETQNPGDEGLEARLAELEGVVAERDKEITALKGSLGGLEGSLSQTVSAYRSLIIKSTPGLPEELVTGDSVEAIDSSVASAQSLITKVKLGLEAELAGASVPAGAPPRRPVDLSALSPREKIQYAVGERR